jgi:hypothetical protein
MKFFQTNIVFFVIVLFLAMPINTILADYVMPYPSFMPGNKLYKISRIVDQLKIWWEFGNISQTKYHMLLADKYLIEAKTLFEYKQYLLGLDALKRSDSEILKVPIYIQKGRLEGKNMSKLREIFHEELSSHIEILSVLLTKIPEVYTWTPEKTKSTELNIGVTVRKSISNRNSLFNSD